MCSVKAQVCFWARSGRQFSPEKYADHRDRRLLSPRAESDDAEITPSNVMNSRCLIDAPEGPPHIVTARTRLVKGDPGQKRTFACKCPLSANVDGWPYT